MEPVWQALILTSIAGLSTTIGAFLGIINKKPSARFVSFILAVSGGVMIFLSFVEMFVPAWQAEGVGNSYALLFLGVGLGIGFLFDIILPEDKNVHEHILNGELGEKKDNEQVNVIGPGQGRGRGRFHQRQKHHHPRFNGMRRRKKPQCKQMYCIDNQKFMKLGILTVLALFLHNLPEGLATFSATLLDTELGIELAIATAMHNIPEGISVAIPIYLATGNKRKAVLYAFISGLAEPVGGLIAYAILLPFISTMVLNLMLALTAGIMIYITVDVLIPTAKLIEYKHTMIIGFTVGMLAIGVTILLLQIK